MNLASLPAAWAGLTLVLAGHLALGSVAAAQSEVPTRLDCEQMGANCSRVLPGATRFERMADRPFVRGYDADGQALGYLVLSTEVVDIPAYSGKPLITLVGIDTAGVISGARVLHHSEPILLVGIPRSELDRFAQAHVGKPAQARIVVGGRSDGETIAVDVISGATVTALAQNRTILDSARIVGIGVGLLDAVTLVPGHFVDDAPPWSWQRMADEEVFGRLTVTEAEMGAPNPHGDFIDLYYTLADPPQVGRALFGDRTYERLMGELEPGQHLVVVYGNGSSSFKGSGFVRGGLFDRVRLEQGMTEIMFRDRDYQNPGQPLAEGAPRFKESAVFMTRGGNLDPGAAFKLIFLASRYDGRGGFSRDFQEFIAELRLPSSVYFVEEEGSDSIWVQAWNIRLHDVIALIVFLGLVFAVFAERRFSVRQRRIERLHLASMIVSFFMVGVYMGAQPSVTQILTLLDSVVHEWRWELFATEPLLFVSWIFIAVVSVVWGRGVFCGWVCPYGAMSELIFKIGHKLGVKPFELPERVHQRARYLRYVVLVALVAVYLVDSVLGEKLAEIEPFKSTFLVPFWRREWWFGAWWLALAVVSTFWFRPFCRYLCPLGGGLALLSSIRLSGPYRRRFCSKCTICTRGCEPRAIRPDGTIDPRECLSCMECEAKYHDPETCPPLIALSRLTKKPKGDWSMTDTGRYARMKAEAKKR